MRGQTASPVGVTGGLSPKSYFVLSVLTTVILILATIFLHEKN
jgi:hypothetical protein